MGIAANCTLKKKKRATNMQSILAHILQTAKKISWCYQQFRILWAYLTALHLNIRKYVLKDVHSYSKQALNWETVASEGSSHIWF